MRIIQIAVSDNKSKLYALDDRGCIWVSCRRLEGTNAFKPNWEKVEPPTETRVET